MTPRTYPIVVLSLVALVALLFGLYVTEKATHYSANNTKSVSGPGQQTQYQWRLVTTWPKNFPGLGAGPERFARIVEEMSAGRIKIKVHGAGEIVPALGVFDAVSGGSVEMGHGAAYYWKGKVPAAQFFTSVPFGMNTQEMNGWLHYGGGLELWREIYQPFNLVPFAGGSTGVQSAGWFNREINSMSDLEGLKMRMPGLGGEVITRAGGTAVNIPGGELFTALQTGVIDATEWVGPYNDLSFGFQQVTKNMYYPGWHEPGGVLEFIIHKPVWDSLPADLQAIIRSAARDVNQDMLDEYTARNNTALRDLVENHGVNVQKLPDDILREFKRIARDIMEEQAQQDPAFAKVYESFKAFEAQVAPYHKISEQAYYDTRTLAD